MLNKSEICVIVGGYPQNNQDTALLSLTIESFKRYGYDICLVSHSPINNDLQQASKYTIYSDENYSLQFPEPSSIATFIDNGLVRFQTNNGNRMGAHSFAILMNLKNALWLLKNKKYTHFIYVECDTFLTSEDQRLLEKKLEESNFMENDGWFMVESYSDISLVPVTSIFGGNINYFSNTLEDVNTADDYIKTAAPKCGYSLEAFIAAKFPNPEYYHLFKPRDLFSSKWLGISNYGAVAIPELDNNFTVDIDIVRNANDSNSIICVVNVSSKPELIHLKIYKDINTADDYIKTAAPKHGYSLEAFIAAKFPNPEYYHLFKPRDLFSSKWLGISNYGAVAIPELDNNFNVEIDIVRSVNDNDSIICVVNVSSKPELIHLKIYKDNQLENSTDLTTGPLYWWGFPKENTNVWRMEIYKNDKLISQVERTIEEIFWNYWSFFESRNLEN